MNNNRIHWGAVRALCKFFEPNLWTALEEWLTNPRYCHFVATDGLRSSVNEILSVSIYRRAEDVGKRKIDWKPVTSVDGDGKPSSVVDVTVTMTDQECDELGALISELLGNTMGIKVYSRRSKNHMTYTFKIPPEEFPLRSPGQKDTPILRPGHPPSES